MLGLGVNSCIKLTSFCKRKLKNFIDKNRKKQILNHTPMNRFGETSELIGGALYLASDASKFVTGTELTIDGGFSCMTI